MTPSSYQCQQWYHHVINNPNAGNNVVMMMPAVTLWCQHWHWSWQWCSDAHNSTIMPMTIMMPQHWCQQQCHIKASNDAMTPAMTLQCWYYQWCLDTDVHNDVTSMLVVVSMLQWHHDAMTSNDTGNEARMLAQHLDTDASNQTNASNDDLTLVIIQCYLHQYWCDDTNTVDIMMMTLWHQFQQWC